MQKVTISVVSITVPQQWYNIKSCLVTISVPEFIDPVFTKTSPKRSFLVIQNKRFGLVFAKTGSKISGTGIVLLRFKTV
jgi:hypothetical protein